ncbi:MAG TPA: GTPase ObgE [Candidatus Paceibacterota bacterium]|nr:GTPase ObgE [Candidatus Paceibacterota bacterium]
MAFIDELTIHIRAGKGGDGVVRFRHEKAREFGGPSGGDGGRGGNVYVVGSRDLGLLFKYRHEKAFRAEDGGSGMRDSMHGKNGEDLVLPLPIGSIVKNLDTGKIVQVLSEEEKVLILSGGAGGLGNEHFKSPTHRAPEKHTLGKPAEEGDFYIELQLVVDVGFAGYPNAGKSSLLNALTNASAKIGAYQFTTLEPNLGAFYGFILADIPGLIEGASEGKGLGHKFLRHIKRTKMIAHLISLENEDVEAAYQAIRAELTAYSDELAEKDEIIVLTKTDCVDDATIAKAKKKMEKHGKPVFAITILDDVSVKNFADELVKLLRKRAEG